MRVLPAVAAVLLVAAGFTGCVTSTEDLGTSSAPGPEAPADEGGFSQQATPPGDYNVTAQFSQTLDPGRFDILDPTITTVQSDVDGAKMEIGVFRPDVPEGKDVPVIVYASPYIFGGMSPEGLRDHYMHEMMVKRFVPHGYAVAFVPIRGTADNGGCMNLMGQKEQKDLDQAITWLGTRNWSNGNVGMYGASYDGSTPWEVASQGNPYLETIVPVSGVNDVYDLMYGNGTTESRGPVILNALYYSFGFLFYNKLSNGRSVKHMLEGAACPNAFEGFGASVYSGVTGERDPTGYWEARNLRTGVEENYNGSVLLVQGLQDWNVNPAHNLHWVKKLDHQGLTVKYVLGQWNHAFPDWAFVDGEVIHPRMDWAEIMLHWFDYYLKGNHSVDLGPKVEVQDSSGRWHAEEDWPPQDAEATDYYAQPGQELSGETTSETATVTLTPRSDDAERVRVEAGPQYVAYNTNPCNIGVCFELGPVKEDLRFAGTPEAELTVTPTGPGGHLEVRLFVVDDDGDAQRLGWGQVDLRFEHGGEEAQQVTPGETMEATVWVEPLDAVVPKGQNLVLRVSQSTSAGHMMEPVTNPVQLHLGDGQSRITLETFDRGPAAFYDPPSNT